MSDNEYAPTTEQIRYGYATDDENGKDIWHEDSAIEFDRWLAAHDAQVREEGAKAVVDYYENETVGVAAFRWSATKTHFALTIPSTGAENTDSDEKERQR